ncbi:endolytic transglycosylase MltG [Nitratiruptor sp. YY09-18]|uniref:endolytic transglycosylase MltG n=1 Tax=Nitratiruptor sp. YY09-18 TaxID=2724901 RepID=UPI001915D505|nr:endolytic transglycosylase MltG [Nitratiruptor sp. YY09-18]BCD68050.1 UPF0755 protein [Nitratiruptor sp. YY09-18]
MAKKALKKIILIFEAILIIITLLCIYLSQTIKIEDQTLYIPRGSIAKIITHLQTRKGLPLTKIDRYILSFIGKPQHGWITVQKKRLTHYDFLVALTRSKAALESIKLIPGETTYNILHSLAKKKKISYKVLLFEYKKWAPYPEGVFFANTYFVPVGMDGRKLIHYLVQKGLLQHKYIAKKYLGSYNQKIWFERVVTIASIIQKEAANKEEMAIIASVIYNRLRRKMPLQMDGTLNYGKFSHVRVTPQRIRKDLSRFNTYKYSGLPPFPVCIVSLDAIKAAIKPAKTDYLYFVKSKDGLHIFSKTYKKHLMHIKDVQK